MVCRHAPGDPNCSSTVGGHAWHEAQRYQERLRQESAKRREKELLDRQEELLARTPNPEVFDLLELEQVGPHLVAMVQYTSCTKCSFDAKKVMVFFNRTVKHAAFWKEIDPHFDEPGNVVKRKAPPPRARFPADERGWRDAITFAKMVADQMVTDEP